MPGMPLTPKRPIYVARAPDQAEPAYSPPDLVVVDVHGNAFLRNMVRILVGTLVEIGVGDRDASQVPEMIKSGDRAKAGITAPAHGLELVEVRYDGRRSHCASGV